MINQKKQPKLEIKTEEKCEKVMRETKLNFYGNKHKTNRKRGSSKSLKICQILLELAEEVPIYNIGFYAYAKMFNKF